MTLSAHPLPGWFGQNRYGLFVHASIASVPAFAPVGEYAEWYWSHLSPTRLADVLLHPAPLPEVVQHHEEQYGAGFAYDDFLPLLRFERWDADALAALAVEAGMRYVVHVGKHHDGFCWWDSALTARTSVQQGPRRDIVGELAAASRRAGLEYGLYYSLLDWAHPAYPDQAAYVDGYLRPQLAELVERYTPAVLWGDGHWGHSAEHWRSEQIVDDYYAAMARHGLPAAINDRWGVRPDFVTYEYDAPPERLAAPFEVCRGLGPSFGYNRAEREADLLTPPALIALLTETVAKGGNLLLNVGLNAAGEVPDMQAQTLRTAGAWIRTHADALHGSVPFAVWGDAHVRYTLTPGAGPLQVNAIDLRALARPTFAQLPIARYRVQSVRDAAGRPIKHSQDNAGLHLRETRLAPGAVAPVYRVTAVPAPAKPVRIVAPPPPDIRIGARRFTTITAALAEAVADDEIAIGPGRYTAVTETFPLVVPAGVKLSGAQAVIDASDAPAEQDLPEVIRLAGVDTWIAGLTVRGARSPGRFRPAIAVRAENVDGPIISHCVFEQGSALIKGGGELLIEHSVFNGCGIELRDTVNANIESNTQADVHWGAGIRVFGGAGNMVIDNSVAGNLAGIQLHAVEDGVAMGNRVSGRWWAIHVDGCTAPIVEENEIADTMRAITISGGTGAQLLRNDVRNCDSGALLEGEAADTALMQNTFAECRVGVFVWAASGTHLEENEINASRDIAVYARGPDAVTLTDNEIAGGRLLGDGLPAAPQP